MHPYLVLFSNFNCFIDPSNMLQMVSNFYGGGGERKVFIENFGPPLLVKISQKKFPQFFVILDCQRCILFTKNP